jgi:hypothetical protein
VKLPKLGRSFWLLLLPRGIIGTKKRNEAEEDNKVEIM